VRVTWRTPLIVLLVAAYWGAMAVSFGFALDVVGTNCDESCGDNGRWQYDPQAWQWDALAALALIGFLSALLVFARRVRLWRLVFYGIQLALLALVAWLAGLGYPASLGYPQVRIWIMNADGSGQRRLTQPASFDPAWSPDGTKVAFLVPLGLDDSELRVINADGGGQRTLTREVCTYPAWSPDGGKIAFVRTGGECDDIVGELHVVNADGGGLRRLARGAFVAPAWSPDGSRILFKAGQIYVMNADGSRQRGLSSPGLNILNYPGAWSPDGRKIAFVGGDAVGEIYVMNADGSRQRRLTSLSAYETFPQSPAWSPDGRKIAFVRRDGDLRVMNADGSKPRTLTRNVASASGEIFSPWSPDGSKITFARQRDSDYAYTDIYVINADGSEERRLTGDSQAVYSPVWSPDGRRIAFESIRGSVFRIPWPVLGVGIPGELFALLAIAISGRRPQRRPRTTPESLRTHSAAGSR